MKIDAIIDTIEMADILDGVVKPEGATLVVNPDPPTEPENLPGEARKSPNFHQRREDWLRQMESIGKTLELEAKQGQQAPITFSTEPIPESDTGYEGDDLASDLDPLLDDELEELEEFEDFEPKTTRKINAKPSLQRITELLVSQRDRDTILLHLIERLLERIETLETRLTLAHYDPDLMVEDLAKRKRNLKQIYPDLVLPRDNPYSMMHHKEKAPGGDPGKGAAGERTKHTEIPSAERRRTETAAEYNRRIMPGLSPIPSFSYNPPTPIEFTEMELEAARKAQEAWDSKKAAPKAPSPLINATTPGFTGASKY